MDTEEGSQGLRDWALEDGSACRPLLPLPGGTGLPRVLRGHAQIRVINPRHHTMHPQHDTHARAAASSASTSVSTSV